MSDGDRVWFVDEKTAKALAEKGPSEPLATYVPEVRDGVLWLVSEEVADD